MNDKRYTEAAIIETITAMRSFDCGNCGEFLEAQAFLKQAPEMLNQLLTDLAIRTQDVRSKTAQAEAWKEAAEYALGRVLGLFARPMTIEQAQDEFTDLCAKARALEAGETEGKE